MRAYVFADPALARRAGQFVWLELDTEKSKNASVAKRLGIPALPTFFILDPGTEEVALRWVGGATVAQLDRILDDGRTAVARATADRAAPAGAGAKTASRGGRTSAHTFAKARQQPWHDPSH